MSDVTSIQNAQEQSPDLTAAHNAPNREESNVSPKPKSENGEKENAGSNEQVAEQLIAILPSAMFPYLPGDHTMDYHGLRTPICFYTESGEEVIYDPHYCEAQRQSATKAGTPLSMLSNSADTSGGGCMQVNAVRAGFSDPNWVSHTRVWHGRTDGYGGRGFRSRGHRGGRPYQARGHHFDRNQDHVEEAMGHLLRRGDASHLKVPHKMPSAHAHLLQPVENAWVAL